MNKLTDRLQLVADLVEINESIADIGTDHGFLPIFLKGINPNRKVILTDISKESLNKAKDNAEKYSNYSFDFRLGDGLHVLDNSEVNTVILLGIGGLLTTKILNDDLTKAHSFNKYIFGPRNHVGELRYYLSQNGFVIKKEDLVKEGRFICNILTVIPGTPKFDSKLLELDPSAIEWEYPKTLLEADLTLLKRLIKHRLDKEKLILFNLYSATRIDDIKVQSQKHRIEYLEHFFD